MAATEWFVNEDGVESGPFQPAEVKQMVADGRITAGTAVRRGDQQQAVPASRIKGLLAAAAPVSPPTAPDDAETASAQASGPRPARRSRARGAAADSPFAPPEDDDDDLPPERGRGSLGAVMGPLVRRQGWMVLAGVVQILIGALYLVMAAIGGRFLGGAGVFQLLVVAATGAVFVAMGVLLWRAAANLRRARRTGRAKDYQDASKAIAGFFTVVGILCAVGIGLFALAFVGGMIGAFM